MYSTAPAQEQGARLPAMRHRRYDDLLNSNIIVWGAVSVVDMAENKPMNLNRVMPA